MRIDICWVVPCTAGYNGWLVHCKPSISGEWLLIPTAGDSYSLVRIQTACN